MPFLRHDERFLHRALDHARAAAAFASPNPAVGCVLTCHDQILGEGAHRYDLRDHAEIMALKQAAALGHSVRNATAYVTLEPCSHHGRTGPCAEALIAAGISRCVVATVDPNPLVRGRGLDRLRLAGVEVAVADPASDIAQQARRLNNAFAFAIQHGRPFVTLKAAVSSDGKLAPPAASRTQTAPHWITGPAARADVQQLRHHADALLTGIGTVLADNPEFSDRTGLARRRPLLRVVLDSHLRIPLDSKLVRSAADDLLLVCSPEAFPVKERALTTLGIELLRSSAGSSEVSSQENPQASHQASPPPSASERSLQPLLHTLFARSIRSVLVEGGSALNGGLLDEDLVDQLAIYVGPDALGADALPFAEGQPDPFHLLESLTDVRRETFPHGNAQDLRATGYLHDPWQGIGA